jgi:ABC-type branched-subunit amino acid transport system permease subunit
MRLMRFAIVTLALGIIVHVAAVAADDLASLELGVSLSTQSVFYMGSVSTQFTAAAVVLAAEQGFPSPMMMSVNTFRSFPIMVL